MAEWLDVSNPENNINSATEPNSEPGTSNGISTESSHNNDPLDKKPTENKSDNTLKGESVQNPEASKDAKNGAKEEDDETSEDFSATSGIDEEWISG